MKKIGLKLLVAVFAICFCVGGFAGCTAREDTLIIYNWGEYMDETVLGEFKDWYEAEYEKKIKVKYETFEANEDVEKSLKSGDDWDVICPSDYMIDRLVKNDMLQPLDESVVAEFASVGDPRMKAIMDEFGVGKYAVPYLWGTFGIMYDTQRVPANQVGKLSSWSALWDPAFAGKIYMKTQVRDSYTAAMLYSRREELKEKSDDFTNYANPAYQQLLTEIFQNFSETTKNEAKAVLELQAPRLKKYEGDEGKMEMAGGSDASGYLGLFWSCDAGFAMSDSEEEPGFFSCSSEPIIAEGNKNLGYVVPDEGSNLWVDGWAIPKNAKNTHAANAFIKFTLRKEIAMLNSEYAGSPSANFEAFKELKKQYEEDDEFFKGSENPEAFKRMYLEARFPSDETLARCAVMKDFGDMQDAFYLMFEGIKSSI